MKIFKIYGKVFDFFVLISWIDKVKSFLIKYAFVNCKFLDKNFDYF